MKFNEINNNIEAVLGTDDWTQHNISAYPANYQGQINGNEWVRLNVFSGNSNLLYGGTEKISGQIVFNIFVPAGNGMGKATEIADLLKGIFGNKIISGIQTTNSFITTLGLDQVNKGLFRLDLTINFNNYN